MVSRRIPNPTPGTYSLAIHVFNRTFLSPFAKCFITFCFNKNSIKIITRYVTRNITFAFPFHKNVSMPNIDYKACHTHNSDAYEMFSKTLQCNTRVLHRSPAPHPMALHHAPPLLLLSTASCTAIVGQVNFVYMQCS